MLERIGRLVSAAALAAVAAACGQGETQNVMVPRATPLTEAQVERALGPEPQDQTADSGAVAGEPGAADNQTEEEQQ